MTVVERMSSASVVDPERIRAPGVRIAIVRLGAIGDVVNTMPLVNALRDALPHAHITWVIEPKSLPIVEGHAAVDELVVFPRKSFARDGVAFVRALRACRFDVVLDTQRLLKSALVSLASGCSVRVAFDRRRSKEGNWWFATAHLPTPDRPGVMVDQFREFATALGLPLGPVRWDVPVGAQHRAAAERIVANLRRPFAIVNLGASKPENLWPAARYGELTRRLAGDLSVEVVWTGGPQDRLRAGGASSVARPALDLVGATDLKTLAAILERAALVVSCDTGPLHLAVAMGTPVVGLYGPADPRRTGPYGFGDFVVRPRDGSRSMESLELEDVMQAVHTLVGARGLERGLRA